MNPRHDARDQLHFSMVLPTANLRAFVVKKLREKYPTLNYGCTWKDTWGYGLLMTVADWKVSGFYWVPGPG